MTLIDAATRERRCGRPFQNLTGRTIGRLTVIGLTDRKRTAWLCRCVCGNECVVFASNLTRGHTQSCGCIFSEVTARRNYRHGKYGTAEYKTWASMKARCANPRLRSFKDYGGRGIKVCPEWLASFDAFLADMGQRPPGHSIERIDTNGDYQPSNCRWATTKEQARNTRCTRRLTMDGTTLSAAEWAERLGIDYKRLHAALQRGLSIEEIAVNRIASRSA